MSAAKRMKTKEGPEDELDVPVETAAVCPMCIQMGVELKYKTFVPWWRGGVIMSLTSFNCQSCFFSNRQCDPVGASCTTGVRCLLKVPKGAEGLVHQKRQLIKSEFASLSIPEIGFEIPARTDKGFMRSIQDVLEGSKRNLRTMVGSHEQGEAIAKFMEELDDVLYGDREWSLLIDDPSGMSFIEPNGSVESDAQLTVEEYERTAEQQQMLSGA